MKRLVSITALLVILGVSTGAASGGPLDPPPVLVQPGRAIFFGLGGSEGLQSPLPSYLLARKTTLCTANFLFRGAGKVYLASAAHCPIERLDSATHDPIWLSEGTVKGKVRNGFELVWPGKHGVPVYARSSAPGLPIMTTKIGTVAYAIFNVYQGFEKGDPDLSDPNWPAASEELPAQADVSLTELDRHVSYNESLCVFGGPVGLAEGRVELQQGVMVAQSAYMGQLDRTGHQLLPVRTGLVMGTEEATDYSSVEHYMPNNLAVGGDSGAPVMTATGQALGPTFWVSAQKTPYRLAHTGLATMLSSVLPRAEAALGIDLELMTAPLRSTPDLTDCR